MSQVNYKEKYLQLKQRFQESVDVAFRLGYEQGAQAQQQQQMQQQQQQVADQQAAQAQAAAGGGQFGGDPGEGGEDQGAAPGGAPGAQLSEDSRGVGQQAQGAGGTAGPSELDNHIGELEGLMAKAEYGTEGWETLKKSIDTLKSYKSAVDFKKNEQLIKSIGENLRKPLKLNIKANHNIAPNAKSALTLQHKIVGDIMDQWDKEEKGIPTEITKILASESLVKKD